MSGKFGKALDVLKPFLFERKIMKRSCLLAKNRKVPVVAAALRLFVAGAFAMGQPVYAEPTNEPPVRTTGAAFAALQDFVQTQRVVSLNFAQPSTESTPSAAPSSERDPYAVLADFVRVADASGSVPLPSPQGQAPDDAIHAAARSGGDAYSVLRNFVRADDASGAAPGQAPNHAIHAGLQGDVSPSVGGQAPDDAIHAGLHGDASLSMGSQAPDDAIHAGLHSPTKSGADAYSALADFVKDDPGKVAPADAVYAGPHSATRGDAKGGADSKPMVLAAAAAAPKPKKPVAEAAESGPATYVGSAACIRCHRDQFGTFEQTLMGQIFLHHPRDAQEKEGCESCHGPGSKHVKTKAPEDIISFAKDSPLPVVERNAICLSCHERGDRTYWDGSVHQTRDLACTTCHQVMEKVSVKFQLAKSTEPEVCFQCHKDVRAKMVNSSHMPLLNGSITCSSCHNPHGSATDGLLREASVNETCYKCHADKRGPFLWEHEPVRDNCLNCHNPHGSVNEYMLIIQRPRLCQSCHMGPGHGNPGNPMTVQSVNRSCQNCHTLVHGSNSPAGELFQR